MPNGSGKEVEGLAYVSGFADADGGVTNHGVTITNTDVGLLRMMSTILESAGIANAVCARPVPTNQRHSQVHSLYITGFRNLLLFYHRVGFRMERKRNKLAALLAHYSRKGTQYCLSDYQMAMELVEGGMAMNKVSLHIGVGLSTVNRRFERGTWPLSQEVIEALTFLQQANCMQ